MDSVKYLKKIKETVSFLNEAGFGDCKTAVVLGSGLGSFADKVRVLKSLPYKDIPHFLPTTVIGHKGQLLLAEAGNKKIIVQQGRNHFYEGHGLETVVFPVRCFGKIGVKNLVLTNSAGGMGDGMKAGELMIIEDHLNLTGTNPLLGPNMEELGPRFPDMSEAYNRELVKKMEASFAKLNLSFKKGIYGGLSGPTYETPAEVRYLKMIGCSAVGMSTVTESIAANHMGMRVAGLSCITNLAAGISKHKLTHDEVTETAKLVENQFVSVLLDFVSSL